VSVASGRSPPGRAPLWRYAVGVRDEIRHIVLTGLMGSGKTTVGRKLAEEIGWDWRDSDVDIEAATGRTVRELRDEEGVDAMHAREAAALIDALAVPERNAISAAASVVDVAECRTALAAEDVAVIWLRAAPAVLAKRFAAQDHRPAYGDSPEVFLAEQAARREPLLESLDAIAIDVDVIPPDEVVRRAIDALG
jgi:shikimate kinase